MLVCKARGAKHRGKMHELLGVQPRLLGKLACGALLALLAPLELAGRDLERYSAKHHPVLANQAHPVVVNRNDSRAAMMVDHLAPCVRAIG